MTEHTVWVPYEYRLTYIPKGGRNPKHEWVKGQSPVVIREIDAKEAPKAIEMTILDKWWFNDNAPPPMVRETLRSYNGGLVHLAAPKGTPIGLREISIDRSQGEDSVWGLSNFPFRNAKYYGFAEDRETLRIREVVSDGQEAEEARVRQVASQICIIDGQLWVPHSEPVWTVDSIGNRLNPRVALMLTRSGDSQNATLMKFRADRFEEAREYARWLTSDYPFAEPNANIEMFGEMTFLDETVLKRNDLTATATELFGKLTKIDGGSGFAQLPRECILGWVNFRDAADAFLKGDPGAVHRAYENLTTMIEHMPEIHRNERGEILTSMATYFLRQHLLAPLHRYHAFDRDIIADPDAEADFQAMKF